MSQYLELIQYSSFLIMWPGHCVVGMWLRGVWGVGMDIVFGVDHVSICVRITVSVTVSCGQEFLVPISGLSAISQGYIIETSFRAD